jgi:hypothetical protein
MRIIDVLLIITCFLIISCGRDETNQSEEIKQPTYDVDVCKCLTEPGNSLFIINNKDACRETISEEIGVENWEKINMSQNPDVSAKFDALAEKCTGTKDSGIEIIDQNNKLIPEIGTSAGYIWELIDQENQLYGTLAFDGLIFRSSMYSMNGKSNSEDFTKIIDLSGSWSAVDDKHAEGVISGNDVPVNWTFGNDYSSLTNNKGVIFNRVLVK